MDFQWNRTASGDLELLFGDDQVFDRVKEILVSKFNAVPGRPLAGIDQVYWDFDVEGSRLTLHEDGMAGVALISRGKDAEAALKRVAEFLAGA